MTKDQVSTIITVAAVAYLLVRLYQKYVKKTGPGQTREKQGNTGFGSSNKGDDYEPYQK
ncbi:MAG: hypothetical protein U0X39_01905 [Bacteroidales bacterium]